MASPGELIFTLSEVLGVPIETVTLIDRALAGAGLRSKGGRGRSAARMTGRDAANLLIGAVGSALVKDAVRTVESDFGPLRAENVLHEVTEDKLAEELNISPTEMRSTWEIAGNHLPRLQAMIPSHTFGEAISALIESAAEGLISEHSPDALVELEKPEKLLEIRVKLFFPVFRATISIRNEEFRERVNYGMTFEHQANWRGSDARNLGDLRYTRKFTERTVLALGRLVAG